MHAERFDLEGHEIRVIDTGHTDTDDTTALHIPSLGLLIAGDAIYNETHPFLAESDRAGRQAWLAAIDRLAAINPQAVVVGHGPLDPDCSPHHIDATRRYIRDFDRVDRETATAHDLYDRMLALLSRPDQPGLAVGQCPGREKRNLRGASPLSIIAANAAPLLKSNYGDEVVRLLRMTAAIAEESVCQEK